MSQESEPTPTATTLEKAISDAVKAVVVQTNRLETLDPGRPAGEPMGVDGLRDVPVPMTIELGRTRMPLHELLALAPGSLVTLGRAAHEPVDIFVGGRLYARGEVVTVGDKYGVRVIGLASS